MSQQMHFDEEQRGYHQASYTPIVEEGSGSYQQQFAAPPAQKVGTTYGGESRIASAGQRLALAIVSVVMLLGGMAMLTNGDTSSPSIMGVKLAGLIVVSLTIGAINVVFNRHR